MSDRSQSVSSYLIQRLYDHGVRYIFGVPGDFVLGFYHELVESNKLKVVNTCDEQGAGFAADAGAQLANPLLRPIVIVGDGAFQMTGMEVSTLSRFGLNPVIIILNNKGHGTERPLLDGP